MNLLIKSDYFYDNLFKDISILTDKALVEIKRIKYNKDKGNIEIPLKRYIFNGYKKNIFNKTKKPIFLKEKMINSILIIKNIKNCKITDNSNSLLKTIIILFGVQFSNNKIYFSSAEEDRGNLIFEVEIFIDKFDIEFRDLS